MRIRIIIHDERRLISGLLHFGYTLRIMIRYCIVIRIECRDWRDGLEVLKLNILGKNAVSITAPSSIGTRHCAGEYRVT